MHRSGNLWRVVRCIPQVVPLFLLLFTTKFAASRNLSADQSEQPRHSDTLLTTAKQIHVLTADQARLGYPVKIEGVVTYFDPEQHFFFMQDRSEEAHV